MKDQFNFSYKLLCKLKQNLFCHKRYLNKILDTFLEQECDCECSDNLIDTLIQYMCYIECYSNCSRNYSYLAQIDLFKCILKNLKKILHQLKCYKEIPCDLEGEFACVLYKIIEIIISNLSYINNIECLCNNCACSKEEIINCLLCSFAQNNKNLENEVNILSRLLLDIISCNIVTCTTCTNNIPCGKNQN